MGCPKGISMTFEPSYVNIRCKLWSVHELTKQESARVNKTKNLESVHFTLTERVIPVEPISTKFKNIFSSHRRNYLFKIWYRFVQ